MLTQIICWGVVRAGWGRTAAADRPAAPLWEIRTLSPQLSVKFILASSSVNNSNFEITASKLDHASIKSCGGKVSLCRIPTTRSFFFTRNFYILAKPLLNSLLQCRIVAALLHGLTHLHLLGRRGIGSYGQTSLQFQ